MLRYKSKLHRSMAQHVCTVLCDSPEFPETVSSRPNSCTSIRDFSLILRYCTPISNAKARWEDRRLTYHGIPQCTAGNQALSNYRTPSLHAWIEGSSGIIVLFVTTSDQALESLAFQLKTFWRFIGYQIFHRNEVFQLRKFGTLGYFSLYPSSREVFHLRNFVNTVVID